MTGSYADQHNTLSLGRVHIPSNGCGHLPFPVQFESSPLASLVPQPYMNPFCLVADPATLDFAHFPPARSANLAALSSDPVHFMTNGVGSLFLTQRGVRSFRNDGSA